MGLDIYVGSLTRYFARDWKTVVQLLADAGEIPKVEIIRPERREDVVTDPEQIRAAVLGWRQGLSSGLGDHLKGPLDWDESSASPYFTDKPAWDCYCALLLFAAYSEHPDLKPLTENPLCSPDRAKYDWHVDPAYRKSVGDDFSTRYGQLLRDVEIWLPGDYRFTFGAQWVTGDERRFGSCTAVLAELDLLNTHTWKASESEIAEWRRAGADFGAPLEVGARFAFAVMRELAAKAVEHRLPMLMDY